ncbi:MAG TPA: hypothetical protein PK079_24640 [Leptospiraceae bacterium]|nr:hypothetical protein [Leptospiraceae bacterium]HMW06208.1 hypothetical protein [Leptospiraceae bacterium]HMX34993.1 hypothetical protein [Leptospiraceae bacterium]HMY31670.1 hypothetical protein [Leptospiraceae bacterium]HMZ65663.1 hypothetical protein [Leptospiraceae bacterium]
MTEITFIAIFLAMPIILAGGVNHSFSSLGTLITYTLLIILLNLILPILYFITRAKFLYYLLGAMDCCVGIFVFFYGLSFIHSDPFFIVGVILTLVGLTIIIFPTIWKYL